MNTKSKLKKVVLLKILAISYKQLRCQPGIFKKASALVNFFSDYLKFRHLKTNFESSLLTEDLYPRLFDKTSSTPLDPVYFFQDAWCASKIFKQKPTQHHDIASHAHLIGIISQFVPTTMIDIRPLEITLPGLSFCKGDITNLPFGDAIIESLSSICVLEHIGLGRYGDPLDQFGSENASLEIQRVLASGGNLYISVPIDSNNKVFFNAHRAFTRDYVIKLFEQCELVEEKYIYGKKLETIYDPKKGFGTGLYHFKKK